jgi:hypothetical protein
MQPLQTVKVCGASDYVVTADSEPIGGRYLNVRVEATGAAFEAESILPWSSAEKPPNSLIKVAIE